MTTRVVNGSTFTEDGWPLVDQAGCTWITIPGTNVTIQVQTGQPAAILGAWEADWNAYVEPLEDPTTGCWTEGNSVLGGYGRNNGSNHLGGTAVDTDWEKHPMGPHAPDNPAAGFTVAQVNTIREMIAFYTLNGVQMVWWANDWDTPHDSMHSQMGYGTYGNPLTQQFIDRFIRPDGFSQFRRGSAPSVNVATVLGNAMENEVSAARYAELLPAFQTGCRIAQINTVNRLAMWCAQIGEESGGLKWMEELASGAAYNGRTDLGNRVGTNDGVTYKGRGPLQVTGRAHYIALSQWAFDNGYVPTATYFVDNPTELSGDTYGFVGAAWYWTVERPQLNALADNGDILGATKAVNGGTNGLADRTDRWNKCLAMGDTLLSLINSGGFLSNISDVDAAVVVAAAHKIINSWASRSIYRTSNNPVDDTVGMLLNIDGSSHELITENRALMGEPEAVALVTATATGASVGAQHPDGTPDVDAIARAKFILSKVTK